MNNNDINSLIDILSKMDKNELENNLKKVGQFLSSPNKDDIKNDLNNQR